MDGIALLEELLRQPNQFNPVCLIVARKHSASSDSFLVNELGYYLVDEDQNLTED